AAVPTLVGVPRADARNSTADTLEHAVQLLSLMVRSPDIARRGDRFAYDRPESSVVRTGGEESESVGLRHRFQDLPPCLGGEGVRHLRLDGRAVVALLHTGGKSDGR